MYLASEEGLSIVIPKGERLPPTLVGGSSSVGVGLGVGREEEEEAVSDEEAESEERGGRGPRREWRLRGR